ncbi:MAG TPA: chemotaxis protein CheB [Sphingobium sp.]|nr:chemotaxis protein CheB [Sphingobium sp.]
MHYEAIVIGVSTGGLDALKGFIPKLPASFALPVAIVQHRNQRSSDFLAEHLNRMSALRVVEAEDKGPMCGGYVYLAPATYHLLIEADRSFSLSVDALVNYSRPSVDVLFESAADVFRQALIGIILTGANTDGAQGAREIKARGGLVIVQDPADAEADVMPKAALAAARVDYIVTLDQLPPLLLQLAGK